MRNPVCYLRRIITACCAFIPDLNEPIRDACDARFDGLPWGLIPDVARACNAHVPDDEPFPFEELRELQHPNGIGFGDFHRGDPRATRLVGLGLTVAEARAKFPAETAQLERAIGALRERMRELAIARLR